jgi:hypothetical protein
MIPPLSPVKLKTNGDYFQIFQDVLDKARYKKVVEQLVDKAEGGDLKAQRLVIEHAQGKPTQRIEVISRQEGNLERIQRLLEDAGQPVEWKVTDDEEVEVEAEEE